MDAASHNEDQQAEQNDAYDLGRVQSNGEDHRVQGSQGVV